MARMRAKAYALTGGVIVLLMAVGSWFAIGRIYSGSEAIALIEALSQSALFFGTAGATSSATVLALMLTLVGITKRSDHNFGGAVYRSVSHISTLATVTLCASVILLLVLTFPIGEFDALPSGWFTGLYIILYAMVGTISAMLVATILMLFFTIREVIGGIAPDEPEDQSSSSS